jgi:hypothetical protein
MTIRMLLDEQIDSLQREFDAACQDTAADQGDDIVECGGWVDLARATVDLAGPEIEPEAKREFLRMQGLG